MKAGYFYIGARKGYGRDAEILAERVKGYIEDNLGFYKCGKSWVATYLPLGVALTTSNTRRDVHAQALEMCSAPYFKGAVAQAKDSENFKRFDAARNICAD